MKYCLDCRWSVNDAMGVRWMRCGHPKMRNSIQCISSELNARGGDYCSHARIDTILFDSCGSEGKYFEFKHSVVVKPSVKLVRKNPSGEKSAEKPAEKPAGILEKLRSAFRAFLYNSAPPNQE